MTKRYSKLNLRALLFLLVTIVVVASFTACQERNQMPMASYEVDAPTGPVDENGNVIVITNWVTNNLVVTNKIPEYSTNATYIPGQTIYITNYVTNEIKGETVIKTNYVYITNTIEKVTNIINVVPDTNNYVSKWHPSTMYKVYAPFAGIGPEGDYKYTNLSYLDTKSLNYWWRAVVHRYGFKDGTEMSIKNRNTGTHFYFDDNLDIRWSGKPSLEIKAFVQGVIVQYRGGSANGTWAIAGLYKVIHESKYLSQLWDDGVNCMQGYYIRYGDRRPGELDIVVMNTGHVVDGKNYGFQIYYSSYNFPAGTNPYFEQRPEYYMSKITLVLDLWKNYRPYPIEMQNLPFQIRKRNPNEQRY